MSVLATNLGFPRIGVQRELKTALESYWRGQCSREQLLAAGAELRERHWRLQQAAGLDHIPSNDFSFYDHILDLSCMLGCVPPRYGWQGGAIDLDLYFAMARGVAHETGKGHDDVTALEMSKWFDTNYHYLVPEFAADQQFRLASSKIFDDYLHARRLGIQTRPVLVGPLTYVMLGKQRAGVEQCRSTLLARLTPVYVEILQQLHELGAHWVQIDEPALALDLLEPQRAAALVAYREIAAAVPALKILVTTYFEGLRDNTELAFALPVAGLHLDLCRGPAQANTTANDAARILEDACARAGQKHLSLGVVDGRNVWKCDLSQALALLETAVARLGRDRVLVAPSCSLLHTPLQLGAETQLDPTLRNWLAFATEKLTEVTTLARGAQGGRTAIQDALNVSDAVRQERASSAQIHDAQVQQRLANVTPQMQQRAASCAERRALQRERFALPLLPTTTIGSFPQTAAIRHARAAFRSGELDTAQYHAAMQAEIRSVIDYQERIGLDVLVHGEAERNDMVEYFGEQLAGFAFTRHGWVQSYGSRCVKPPIIFGDVWRARPMTVTWTSYAQSLTTRVMKGMLTGPITLLQWSFVRDDQPRTVTSRQLALAIRDEVADLERAGIRMIQIDEAALREGLPLRRADWQRYLDHAVADFRIAAGVAANGTQIHTHMCYSQFNDILPAIAAMDADVVSIETARSQLELLGAFADYRYPNDIGPGVYDIHSPRVPSVAEIVELLRTAVSVLDPQQLWVNPDCGLKTRGWSEVEPALQNMVAAARILRGELAGG